MKTIILARVSTQEKKKPEKQVDQLACLPRRTWRKQVYKLYGLTKKEVEIIENEKNNEYEDDKNHSRYEPTY